MLAIEDADAREWYAFVLDADEIVARIPNVKDGLSSGAEVYKVWIQIHNVRFPQLRFFRLDKPWTYKGVLHEFPTCEGLAPSDFTLEGFELGTGNGGARSKQADKYKRDAELLEKELETETDFGMITRYVFYLAQSYRDAWMDKHALHNYLRRADLGPGLNWEEQYVALVEAGRAYNRLGEGDNALETFLRAYKLWPARAEATRELAAIFAHRAKTSPKQGTLFVEV
jgi:tetratricopeptide (TPR) repeat protein